MKNLLATMVVFAAGCGSLHESYVDADASTYEVIAPVVSKCLAEHEEYSGVHKEALEDKLVSWEVRVRRALQRFQEAE